MKITGTDMKIVSHNVMSPNQVPFKVNGKNLYEFRRAELRKLAQRLDLPADGKHHELLPRVVDKLFIIGAPEELTELNGFRDDVREPPEMGGGRKKQAVPGHDGAPDNRDRKKSKRKGTKPRRNRPPVDE